MGGSKCSARPIRGVVGKLYVLEWKGLLQAILLDIQLQRRTLGSCRSRRLASDGFLFFSVLGRELLTMEVNGRQLHTQLAFSFSKFKELEFAAKNLKLECSRLCNSWRLSRSSPEAMVRDPPAHSEPRSARRWQNSVRAIFRVHRQ